MFQNGLVNVRDPEQRRDLEEALSALTGREVRVEAG